MRHILLIAVVLSCPGHAESDSNALGQKLTKQHCGRCHVVPGGNPFGSIGSTPSFRVLRNYPDWQARFAAFYAEPPHAAITEIEGVTEPHDPARPPPVTPMRLTEAEMEAILAYVATIEPKDVGRLE